jgi:hypothetical protein
MSALGPDDPHMDTSEFRVQAPRHGRAERADRIAARGQSSALIVAGVALAISGTGLTVASSPDHTAWVAFGFVLLIAGTTLGVAYASTLRQSLTATGPQRHGARSQDNTRRLSRPTSFHDSITSAQFGPDPEQVIGRQTGART